MTRAKEFFKLLEGIQLNKQDKDVRRVNKETWNIFHDNRKYVFKVEEIMNKIYNVYWYLEGPSGEHYVKLPDELKNKKLMMMVFNKVLTAFYQFLDLNKPNEFLFSNDKKLSKIYAAMLLKVQYEDPFKWYLNRSIKKSGDKVFHYYSRKNDLMTESKWNKLLGLIG